LQQFGNSKVASLYKFSVVMNLAVKFSFRKFFPPPMAGQFSQLGKYPAPAKAALRYLERCSCGIASFSGRTTYENGARHFAHLADTPVEQTSLPEYDAATKRKILVIHLPTVFERFLELHR